MMYVCTDCHQTFAGSAELSEHTCRPQDHGIQGFGQLGQTPEQHEEARIRDLAMAPLHGEHLPAVATKADLELEAAEQGKRMAIMLKPLVAEIKRDLQATVDGLRQDIEANTDMMKGLDVPLEAITDSHERAASSFERMRAEVTAISERLAGVEKVIDTAGLTAAVGLAERRMSALAAKIETQFTGVSLNMVEILKLLQRLQARELAGVSQTDARVKRVLGKVSRAAAKQ